MSIIVQQLTHTYNPGTPLACTALREVSFKTNPGDWLFVVGQTGSGKSTLVQHLNGLLFASEGKVTVEGILLQEGSPKLKEIRRQVGFLFQYPEQQLFAETVKEELAFAPRNWGISEKIITSRIAQVLQAVGLSEDILQRSPFELSGGQKRRVAIASILTVQPRYLVLDEPTAGLDHAGTQELLTLLESLRQKGVAIIQVTHDLELALKRSTSILLLQKNKKTLWGNNAEIAEHLMAGEWSGMALPPVLDLIKELRQRGIKLDATWEIEALLKTLEDTAKKCNSQIT